MELLCEKHKCLVDEETVDLINRNSRSLGWKAANYSEFWGRRYEEGISSRLGVIHSKKKVLGNFTLNLNASFKYVISHSHSVVIFCRRF